MVGNLLHIHRCVKDINWFAHFPEVFNGLVEIHSVFTPTSELYVDSCLTGMGAFYQGEVYVISVHSFLSLRSIVHLEAANVLVTLRCWAEDLRNSHCLAWCDNWAVVNAFTSHKINDPFLSDCARSVWLICTTYNINIKNLNKLQALVTFLLIFCLGGAITSICKMIKLHFLIVVNSSFLPVNLCCLYLKYKGFSPDQ